MSKNIWYYSFRIMFSPELNSPSRYFFSNLPDICYVYLWIVLESQAANPTHKSMCISKSSHWTFHTKKKIKDNTWKNCHQKNFYFLSLWRNTLEWGSKGTYLYFGEKQNSKLCANQSHMILCKKTVMCLAPNEKIQREKV